MELPRNHPPKEVSPDAMVLPRPLRYLNAAMPFLAPTQATNLALSSGERHPKEANPLPL
jgi:hypothetical protein